MACSFIIYTSTISQTFSNRGTDFWVGYGVQSTMYNADGSVNNTDGGSQEMVLYFTGGTSPANVKVEIPATGWVKNYVVTGTGYTESDPMPKTGMDDARLAAEGISDKGIHITSDMPIGVISHIYDKTGGATSLLIPTEILGQDYYMLNFNQSSEENHAYSFGFVIATEDNTTVEITPSVNTQTHLAGVPFTMVLQMGQIYNLLGAITGQTGNVYNGADLTGTSIRTIASGGAACQKLAVFCGSGNAFIKCGNGTRSSSDNLMQQMLPGAAWGTKYITVPTLDMPNNVFRVIVKRSNTIVTVNGVQLTNLINGRYYEFQSDIPSVIRSDNDIMVSQYITTATQCGNNGTDGDPEMIYLLPITQNLIWGKVVSTDHFATTSHYINVIVPSVFVDSFQLDGVYMGGSFSIIKQDTLYSYAQFKVKAGQHSLAIDTGSFYAVAYGYGPSESYGYSVGFSLRHMGSFLTVQNPYGPPNDIPATCDATPFKMAINLVFQSKELVWSFYNNPKLSPHDSVDIINAIPDSTFNIKGQTYYRYTLPGFYTYADIGTMDLSIGTYSPTQDGCTSLFTIYPIIDVNRHPVADWALNFNKCRNDTLHFMDSSDAYSNKTMQWIWNFGDGTGSALEDPVKKYANYGDYNVTLRTITDIGCFADTAKPVVLAPYPFASFSTNPECEGVPTNFTDLSTISYGAITSWHWDFGDGSFSDQAGSTTKLFPSAGIYPARLTVSNKLGCTDDTLKQLTIYKYQGVSAKDTFVYQGDPVQLKPLYEGTVLSHKWSPSTYLSSDTAAYPVSIPKDDITYHLTVTGGGGCLSEADLFVDVVQLLNIPNVYSPNGDGINDKWIITNLDYYPSAEVDIFNRYGQPVFHSTNYAQKPWDGTFNGKPMPVGTYYYIINAKSKYFKSKSGYVAILR